MPPVTVLCIYQFEGSNFYNIHELLPWKDVKEISNFQVVVEGSLLIEKNYEYCMIIAFCFCFGDSRLRDEFSRKEIIDGFVFGRRRWVVFGRRWLMFERSYEKREDLKFDFWRRKWRSVGESNVNIGF